MMSKFIGVFGLLVACLPGLGPVSVQDQRSEYTNKLRHHSNDPSHSPPYGQDVRFDHERIFRWRTPGLVLPARLQSSDRNARTRMAREN